MDDMTYCMVRSVGLQVEEQFEQWWAGTGLCIERSKRATAGMAAPKFEPEEVKAKPSRSAGTRRVGDNPCIQRSVHALHNACPHSQELVWQARSRVWPSAHAPTTCRDAGCGVQAPFAGFLHVSLSACPSSMVHTVQAQQCHHDVQVCMHVRHGTHHCKLHTAERRCQCKSRRANHC